jgi:hypothetical protein
MRCWGSIFRRIIAGIRCHWNLLDGVALVESVNELVSMLCKGGDWRTKDHGENQARSGAFTQAVHRDFLAAQFWSAEY